MNTTTATEDMTDEELADWAESLLFESAADAEAAAERYIESRWDDGSPA